MAEKTIRLQEELVERLENLAQEQGRTVDEVFSDLLEFYAPSNSDNNWALALAEGMEAADIDWTEDPDASVRSRERYNDYLAKR